MRGYFRNIPIRRKLTMVMVLSTTAGLALAAVALIGYTWFTARANAVRDLDTLSLIVADNTAVALAFGDASVAAEMLSALRAKTEIESACLYARGKPGSLALFAHYAATGASVRDCPVDPAAEVSSPVATLLQVTRPVSLNGEQVGLLRLTQNLEGQRRALMAQIAMMGGIVLVSFVISFGIARAMQRVFAGPVLELAAIARQVSESRNYSLRAPQQGGDEVGRLVEDFNGMLEQIALRDSEILRAEQAQRELNHSLEQQVKETTRALERLREAQAQLVQNEKLASLGALVAGVAHEINTPIGVGVTAASTLQANATQLRQLYTQGTLRRSELERFVALADEASHIILKNLQRGAELIHSFKQVAVDQSSGERRRFSLKAYLDEVLLSLRPQLKKTPFRVEVDCPDGVVLDSFPGALAQIVTNLVTNSMIHGFDGRDHGLIQIEARAERDWVTLRYRDDGRGIPHEHLSRIYDPFFTTRRGSGGSGLGLHIVYNLVAQLLGGTIEVTSNPGQGTEFLIRIPVRAQMEAA
jgi:signal transduction histidine kinase